MFKTLVSLVAVFSTQALASGASHYTCKGDGIEVRYQELSSKVMNVDFTGEGFGEKHSLQGTGKELRITKSPVGTLITISDHFMSSMDGPRRSLTLILPDVNLRGELTAQFDAVLLKTTHANSIAGPGFVFGSHESNEALTLQCEAMNMVVIGQ